MTKLIQLTELYLGKYAKEVQEKKAWFNVDTIVKITEAGSRFNKLNTTEVVTDKASFIVKESPTEIRELLTNDIVDYEKLIHLMESLEECRICEMEHFFKSPRKEGEDLITYVKRIYSSVAK